MNIEEFVRLSERTERKFPDGMIVKGNPRDTFGMLLHMINMCELIDARKKELIYDKPITDEYMSDLVRSGGSGIDLFMNWLNEQDDIVLSPRRAETLHALIGIVTEVGELTNALLPYVIGHRRDVDLTNVAEELGDLMFYKAILLRIFGIDLEKALENNIEKLRVRYPDKFETELALNRDLEKEREALTLAGTTEG